MCSFAGGNVRAEVEEPVTLDEDPFTGHVKETDISEALSCVLELYKQYF